MICYVRVHRFWGVGMNFPLTDFQVIYISRVCYQVLIDLLHLCINFTTNDGSGDCLVPISLYMLCSNLSGLLYLLYICCSVDHNLCVMDLKVFEVGTIAPFLPTKTGSRRIW